MPVIKALAHVLVQLANAGGVRSAPRDREIKCTPARSGSSIFHVHGSPRTDGSPPAGRRVLAHVLAHVHVQVQVQVQVQVHGYGNGHETSLSDRIGA